jgi:hypothetical protein
LLFGLRRLILNRSKKMDQVLVSASVTLGILLMMLGSGYLGYWLEGRKRKRRQSEEARAKLESLRAQGLEDVLDGKPPREAP